MSSTPTPAFPGANFALPTHDPGGQPLTAEQQRTELIRNVPGFAEKASTEPHSFEARMLAELNQRAVAEMDNWHPPGVQAAPAEAFRVSLPIGTDYNHPETGTAIAEISNYLAALAWTVIVAPGDKVFAYVEGRPFAPAGSLFDEAIAAWKTLRSDADARFDREIVIDCTGLAPQVTWGTSPQHATGIDGTVPDPARETDPGRRQAMERALEYMALAPGTPLAGLPVQAAFIGSCTNSRISDLRAAAAVLKGRRVAPGVKAICVPGSTAVKRAAEREGLDRIFLDAGFEWRESGCSMCFYAGGESFGLEERVVSSTNRNFENRQGPRTRTHLASPATVAASAIAGRLTDPRAIDPDAGRAGTA
jgi:hypothetical protein